MILSYFARILYTKSLAIYLRKITSVVFFVMFLSPLSLFAEYPSVVLDGTNVKDLNEYKISCFNPKSGDYVTETGGAEIRLEIRKTGKTFQVRRQYSEPGIKPHNRVYKNFRRNKSLILVTKGAYFKVINDGGVIFLETSSGVESISNQMWIYYSFNMRDAI